MKILVDDEIRASVIDCKPLKIAVAYIGADWKMFIADPNYLESIIVSPTVGSNPRAIAELVKQIGWEKIFFFDDLHAKVYIGNKSAIIGSANLTRNGLGSKGLVELCVEVESEECLNKVNNFFDDLQTRAQELYPTIESKKSRLIELEQNRDAAIANQIIPAENMNRQSFADFELLGDDHFYVLWYQPVDCEYSDDIKSIQTLIEEDIHFAINDKPEKNKWALVWRITDSSTPHKTAKPQWIYIHDVIDNGVIDEFYEYPKCAIQRKDLVVPTPPFELTNDVVSAFKKALQEDIIKNYMIQDEKDVFSLAYSLRGLPLIISKMKEYLSIKTNAIDANKRNNLPR